MEKIQEIINKGIEEYEKNNKIIGYKKKTIKAIKDCKTGELGAHKYVCDECGYEEIAYNSCRNRHCPNCQIMKKLKWIEARKEEVLNIKYYHVVFTIPSELYNIVYQNQSKMYNVLFKEYITYMGTKLNVSSACAYGSNRRRTNKNTKMERKRRRFFYTSKGNVKSI